MTINVAGMEGFIWWVGVVENRLDPLKIGRAQIRIYHWHTDSKELMPTKELKWALSATPINNDSPVPPKDGQWVMGFYLDGKDAQQPMMMFTLPGIPDNAKDRGKGFNDQRTDEQLKTEPRPPQSKTYKLDGSGVQIVERSKAERFPNKEYLVITDEPTTPRLARNEPEEIKKTFIAERKKHRLKTVPIVNRTSSAEKWEEEKTKYDAKYPQNKVVETEAGHIMEIDDTYGKERIQWVHRSGTFMEIYPKGNTVTKVVNDNYEITMGNDNCVIMGNCNVTIMKDASIYVAGDVNMRTDGSMRLKIGQNYDIEVGGNMTTNVIGSVFTHVGSNVVLNVGSQLYEYIHKDSQRVAKTGLYVWSESDMSLKASGTGIFETGGAMHNKAGGQMYDQASHISHNEGATSAAAAPAAPSKPSEIMPGTPKSLEEANET